jgi:XTP/dITP diphosphohydrolase
VPVQPVQPVQPVRPGRLVLLATTPRVAAGLLSWSAWSLLREADEVYAAEANHPIGPALASAGVELLTPPPGQTVIERADFLAQRASDRVVVWVVGSDGDADLADRLSAPAVVTGSWDLRGARLLDLVAVMDRLRSPGGCPWDAEQTHESLLPYLLEETYETVEVIEAGDLAGLREELGDLLLQVVFHARVGEEHEADPWSVDDVADGIVDKLVSRHPHVFGDVAAGSPDELERTWESLKRAEKGRTSAVDGVPLAQPALALAAKLIGRASKAGVAVAVAPAGFVDAPQSSDDVGAVLLSVVALSRELGVDPEAALRAAARRYAQQVRRAEAEQADQPIASAP